MLYDSFGNFYFGNEGVGAGIRIWGAQPCLSGDRSGIMRACAYTPRSGAACQTERYPPGARRNPDRISFEGRPEALPARAPAGGGVGGAGGPAVNGNFHLGKGRGFGYNIQHMGAPANDAGTRPEKR